MKQIEEVLFEGYKVVWEKVVAAGFVLRDDGYVYQESLLEGQLEALVLIDNSGQLSGRLYDEDLDEEYIAFRLPRVTGAFVGQVRMEYQELLERIREACFQLLGLGSIQGQVIITKMNKVYGDKGAQPFEKFPRISAFRHPVNDKWYALALELQRGKLELGQEDWSQEETEELVEILNIKVPPEQVASLIQERGIYPSYHMNKKHWVTVVLDGSLSDKQIWDLVSQSRELVGKTARKRGSQAEWWVIPANPKVFDIDSEFAQMDEVYWTQKSTIQAGDLVCMYVTAPVQAMRYVCLVLEDHIDSKQVPEEASDKPLMKVRRIHSFEDTDFPRARMQALGVRAVRGPRRLTPEMAAAVKQALGNSTAIVQKEDDLHK